MNHTYLKQREKSEDIIEQISKLLAEWDKKDKILRLFLFGSYARNEAEENSDIDLRVEFTDDASVFDHGALKNYLEASLHKKVDLIETEKDSPFLTKIKNEEILIYEAK